VLIGCLDALIEWLAVRGKARRFVGNAVRVLIGAGLALAMGGLAALTAAGETSNRNGAARIPLAVILNGVILNNMRRSGPPPAAIPSGVHKTRPNSASKQADRKGALEKQGLIFPLSLRRELHDQPSRCRLSQRSERGPGYLL
jgi:hypothetical protein